MASVLFIIRVPYEESSKSMGTENGSEQTVKGTSVNVTSKNIYDQNFKLENESEADKSDGSYESDKTAHDFKTS